MSGLYYLMKNNPKGQLIIKDDYFLFGFALPENEKEEFAEDKRLFIFPDKHEI